MPDAAPDFELEATGLDADGRFSDAQLNALADLLIALAEAEQEQEHNPSTNTPPVQEVACR